MVRKRIHQFLVIFRGWLKSTTESTTNYSTTFLDGWTDKISEPIVTTSPPLPQVTLGGMNSLKFQAPVSTRRGSRIKTDQFPKRAPKAKDS